MASLSATEVLLPDGTFVPGVIELDGDRIAALHDLDDSALDSLPQRVIAPGFVDLQVNGQADIDVATAEGPDWERLDSLMLAHGVTAWCPTLVSAPAESYPAALARIATAAGRPADGRPHIAGAHLEGPFLGEAIGAHRSEFVTPIDLTWLAELPEIVRLVTLAPEALGAQEAIAALVQRGVLVSLGHSLASYEQAQDAVEAGARLVTHVFNAMGQLHHREPGLLDAALTDDRLAVSVIADGVHISAPALRLAFRAKRSGSVVLVSDAIAWHASGLNIVAGAPRLADGTIAGSAIGLDEAVRTSVAAGIGRSEALAAASTNPARLAGLTDRGQLSVGALADVVVLTPDLDVLEVWVSGRRVRP